MRRSKQSEWQKIERSCYFLPLCLNRAVRRGRLTGQRPGSAGQTARRMAASEAPRIGIFDSGIGGLSVLRALRLRLPGAHCSYLADSRFTPWGDRPAAWVVARSLSLSAWLQHDGADLVLVACNTATTLAIGALRARWPGRIFVGVEPGIKPAVAASRNGRIAVLGTSATLASRRFGQLIDRHAAKAYVLRLPCPGLAEAIEADGIDGAVPVATADQATANLPAWALQSRLTDSIDAIAGALLAASVDTVVLGCTHYPLVAAALAQRLGPGVTLIDTADAVAHQVARQLGTAPVPGPGFQHRPPRLLSTGDPVTLLHAARRWIDPLAQPEGLNLPDQSGWVEP